MSTYNRSFINFQIIDKNIKELTLVMILPTGDTAAEKLIISQSFIKKMSDIFLAEGDSGIV